MSVAIWQCAHGSWLFKGSQTLTSVYFKTCCLNYIFLLTVIIYFTLLFVEVLLVLISRDAIKTSGDGVCMWRAAARRPKGRNHREVLAILVLNSKTIFFNIIIIFFLTVIAVQLKLPKFKYFWENIRLMGDAIR